MGILLSSDKYILLDECVIDELKIEYLKSSENNSEEAALRTALQKKSVDFIINIEIKGYAENRFQICCKVKDSNFIVWHEINKGVENKSEFEKAIKEIALDFENFISKLDEKLMFNASTLTITTIPEKVSIRFLDQNMIYNYGIRLKPGLYQIEISLQGYKTELEWVNLVAGLEKTIEVNLCPIRTGYDEVRTFQNIKFVFIPPGSFEMGSFSGEVDELPPHKVDITQGFWMSIYEITQDEWETVMGVNPSNFKYDKKLPVEMVSWTDVNEFIAKLNKKGDGIFRLPTEAEWEYASRAGRKTEFSFGEDEDSMSNFGWYIENGGNQTHPVGQKKPNPWGLYDMYGNVWEWCQDWYDESYYSKSPVKNPVCPETRMERTTRGGSYINNQDFSRSSTRGRNYPFFTFSFVGFRLVRSL
jgi:formylglycine-generating enzyme required for sulfatase activity